MLIYSNTEYTPRYIDNVYKYIGKMTNAYRLVDYNVFTRDINIDKDCTYFFTMLNTHKSSTLIGFYLDITIHE